MSDGNDIQVGERERGKTDKVSVRIREWQGRKYIDIRVFYTQDDGRTWKPSPKGISLRPAEVVDISRWLDRAMDLLVEQEADRRSA